MTNSSTKADCVRHVNSITANSSPVSATTWRSFHVNYLYFGGLAQAGVVLASIFVIIGATWPGPVRHIAAGLSAWVPVTLVLAAIGFFGRHHIYPWIDEPLPWDIIDRIPGLARDI